MDMTRENNENCLFSQSDLHFSGRREFFLPLKNFYEFAEWSYLNDFHNLKYMPINPTQIINSDPGSTRFAWLKFPKKIVETLDKRPTSVGLFSRSANIWTPAGKLEIMSWNAAKAASGKSAFAISSNILGSNLINHYFKW